METSKDNKEGGEHYDRYPGNHREKEIEKDAAPYLTVPV